MRSSPRTCSCCGAIRPSARWSPSAAAARPSIRRGSSSRSCLGSNEECRQTRSSPGCGRGSRVTRRRASSSRRHRTSASVVAPRTRNTSTRSRPTTSTTLNHWAPLLTARLQREPVLADVNLDQQNRGLEVALTIDRETAARLGVAVADIDQALYDAFGQRQVSTMYEGLNQYRVVMEVAPEYWQHPETLAAVYVASASGALVPLSAVATIRTIDGAARRQSSIAVSRGDAVVQPRAGRAAGRSRDGNRECGPRHRPARDGARRLPGHGPSLPDLARQRAVADPRGARRRCTSSSACSTRASCIR